MYKCIESQIVRGALLCAFSVLICLLGLLLYFVSFSYSTDGDGFDTSNKRDRFGYKLFFSGILLTVFGGFLIYCNCYILTAIKLADRIWPEQLEQQTPREQYELVTRSEFRIASENLPEEEIRNNETIIEITE